MLLFALLGFLVAVLAQVQAQGNVRGNSCFHVSIPVIVTSTNLIRGPPKFADNNDLTAGVAGANRRDFAINLLPSSLVLRSRLPHTTSQVPTADHFKEGRTLFF
jgi:hypothetical protein